MVDKPGAQHIYIYLQDIYNEYIYNECNIRIVIPRKPFGDVNSLGTALDCNMLYNITAHPGEQMNVECGSPTSHLSQLSA